VSALLWLALSSLDDIATLVVLPHLAKRGATLSEGVAMSLQPTGGFIMAANKSTLVSNESEVDRIVAALVAARGAKKPALGLTEKLADMAADSGRSLSRIGAGFAAAGENAALAFTSERERQTRRTAQHLLALARR